MFGRGKAGELVATEREAGLSPAGVLLGLLFFVSSYSSAPRFSLSTRDPLPRCAAGELMMRMRNAAATMHQRDVLLAMAFDGIGSLPMATIDRFRELKAKEVENMLAGRGIKAESLGGGEMGPRQGDPGRGCTHIVHPLRIRPSQYTNLHMFRGSLWHGSEPPPKVEPY